MIDDLEEDNGTPYVPHCHLCAEHAHAVALLAKREAAVEALCMRGPPDADRELTAALVRVITCDLRLIRTKAASESLH